MQKTTDVSPSSSPPPTPRAWDRLTQREADVALRLAQGWTNREIAQELEISVKTIDTHRSHVLKKLSTDVRLIRNNSDLTRLAIREGIITAEA